MRQEFNVEKKIYEKKTIANFFYDIGNGGIQKVISLLIKKWKKMGYEVVFFSDCLPNEDDYVEKEEIVRIVLPSEYDEKRRYELQKALLEYRIDYMVYHAWGSPQMSIDRKVCQNNGVKFIVYTHGVFSTIFHDRNNFTPYFVEEIKKCDMVLSLTKVSHSFYSMLGCKSIYLQNPIDEELLKKEKISCDKANILWVGRFVAEKKPLDAIRIFSKVAQRNPNAKMYMVGKGPEEAKAIQLVRKLNLTDRVFLVGYQKDMDEYYMNASILLYTSMYEGFCMVLLEAKAYGIPCVMYDIPYLSMTENPRGIICVEQDSVESAASNIIMLLENRDKYEEMSVESYSSLREMESLYDEDIWKSIFSSDPIIRADNHDYDGKMLELLLNHEEYGVKHSIYTIKNSITYRVGDFLLKIPKQINNWRIKRNR